MYLDYFSLERHPFRITPDPSLFFPGGQDGRGVILNALIYGITSGEGILKVVGEVGSGKTMICRMLEEKLPETVEIVYLANPRLSAREILYAIAIELKLDVTAKTERLKVMHMLQDYLLGKHGQGGTVVVFVEEAQSMPLETLEEIRLLSNLETHQHKLMQIVLFGQPELDKILAQKNIRQLRERITHSFRLEPLTTQATGDYLRYRLHAAGCPRQHIFSPRAEKLIARASSGLTRRINILADKALLAAYADSPSRQPLQDGDVALVFPRHVKAAIRDSDYKGRMGIGWLLGGLGAVALLLAGVLVVSMDLLPVGSSDLPLQVTVDTGTVARAPEQQVPGVADSPGQTGARGEAVELAMNAAGSNEAITAGINEVMAEDTEEIIDENIIEIIDGIKSQDPASDSGAATFAERAVVAGESGNSTAVTGSESEQETVPVGNEPVRVATPTPAASEEEASVPTGATGETAAAIETAVAPADDTQDEIATAQQQSVLVSAPGLPRQGQEPAASATTIPVNQNTEIALVEQETVELLEPPVTVLPSGLAELRMAPTANWLRELENKSGYTIQMFSVPSTNPNGLEEYLQFLQLTSMLDDTFICFMPISSPNSGRWQVMHREFEGVTPARRFVNELPAYVQQYGPYVRNLNDVECSYPVDTRQ